MAELSNIYRILADLVGFPSVSSWPNQPIIEFVKTILKQNGISSHIVPGVNSGRNNLYATIGEGGNAGVILSGHLDVVPVDGQNWHSDPFRAIVRDDRIYGRGTADMKSFLALVLGFVPDILAARLNRPIHLAFSCDEEVGCVGAPMMIEQMAKTLGCVEAVIVGEPSEMHVVNAHKGIVNVTVEVVGKEGHSSAPDCAVSAVTNAARLITYIDDLARWQLANPDRKSRYDPGCTTIHCAVVHGGIADNIVAKDCYFNMEIRTIKAGDDDEIIAKIKNFSAKHLVPAMRAVDPACRFSFRLTSKVAPLVGEPGGKGERLVRGLTGDPAPMAVSYATEAGHFQAAGFSTVICGPGSIRQAHKPDEFITIEQLTKGKAFMEKLIARLGD